MNNLVILLKTIAEVIDLRPKFEFLIWGKDFFVVELLWVLKVKHFLKTPEKVFNESVFYHDHFCLILVHTFVARIL